jgi:hypothetical protein
LRGRLGGFGPRGPAILGAEGLGVDGFALAGFELAGFELAGLALAAFGPRLRSGPRSMSRSDFSARA